MPWHAGVLARSKISGSAAKLAPGFLASVSSHSIGFIFIVGRPRTYVISRRDFDSRVYLRAQWEFSTLARRAAPASRARMPGSLRSRRWPPAPPWRRPPTTSAALLRTLSSLGQPEVAGHSNGRAGRQLADPSRNDRARAAARVRGVHARPHMSTLDGRIALVLSLLRPSSRPLGLGAPNGR